ncbi:hypothetical protein [Thiocystis violacea]|uniref:hypothetical protein n=1 Tax=Thiocystis violacea TaxID=13725 RepID=UPI001904FD1A|nr:hypothetical protein [Thiocystis violacea]MBK1723538.1 hypothetical protein [Thiocystis violacea]
MAVPHLLPLVSERIDALLAEWHQEVLHSAQTEAEPVVNPDRPLVERLQGLIQFSADSTPSLLADERSLRLLEFWSEQAPDALFLLFYTRAETALAHALRRGVEPAGFVRDWQAASRRMMAFQRRHRRRALLIDAERACAQPAALCEALASMGLAFDLESACPTLGASTPVLERLVASHLLGEDDESLAIEAELEACALPLDPVDAPALPDPDALWAEYREAGETLRALGQVRDTQSARIKELEEQLEVLSADFRALSEERDSFAQARAELDRERDRQVQTAAERQRQLDTLAAEKAGLKKERDALSKQVASVTAERDGQAKQLAERAAEIARLEAEHDSHAKQFAEENELLLLQLHQVQEELESIFLSAKGQSEATAELERRIEGLTQERSALTKERDTLAKERSQLVAERQGQAKQLSERQSELAKLTQERDVLVKERAALKGSRDEQASAAAERQRQLDTLAAEKAGLKKERDALSKQVASVTAERDGQAKQLAEHAAEIARIQAMQRTQEDALKDVSEENELLLLQLHQVQEELEVFFLRNQSLEPELEANKTARSQLLEALKRLAQAHDDKSQQALDAGARIARLKRHFEAERQANRIARQQLELALGRLAAELRSQVDSVARLQRQLETAARTASTPVPLEMAPAAQTSWPQTIGGDPEFPRAGDLPAEARAAVPQSPDASASADSAPAVPTSTFRERQKRRKQLKHQRRLIKDSELFDETWYRREYLGGARNVDPVEHYLSVGAMRGLNPSPGFETAYYLKVNQDVLESGMNPLIHYLRFGMSEGRRPTPDTPEITHGSASDGARL